MTKQKAGERKRTVTVTVGTGTVRLMEELNAILAGECPTAVQDLTALAGACVDNSLTEWRKEFMGYQGSDRVCHYD